MQEREGWHIGYHSVQFETRSVTFLREGIGLTLNGIVQGYITDRVSEMLRPAGLKKVLVDIGETRSVGTRRDGMPWRVGIAEPAAKGGIVHTVSLDDRALATSASLGTAFNAAVVVGHIFDPRTRKPTLARKLVSVEARTATLAGALSTALCLMSERIARHTMQQFDDCRIVYMS